MEDTLQHLIDDHLKVFFYTKKVANERFISFAEKAVDSDNLDGRDSSLFLGDTLTIVRHDQIQPGQMETKIVGCPPGYEAVGAGSTSDFRRHSPSVCGSWPTARELKASGRSPRTTARTARRRMVHLSRQ